MKFSTIFIILAFASSQAITDVVSFPIIRQRCWISKNSVTRRRHTSKIDCSSKLLTEHLNIQALPKTRFSIRKWRSFSSTSSILSAQQTDDDDDNNDETSSNHYKNEETLLCLRLSIKNNFDGSSTDALNSISRYCQSFPYAVVLPVQPLMYTPTIDGEGSTGGVEIKFLRKKTEIKSNVDGGIRFFVQYVTDDDVEHDEDDDEYDNEENKSSSINTTDNDNMVIEIIAKRNSKGQTVSKVFAEKLVITSFVASLTGMESTTGSQRIGEPLTDSVVNVQSIYHKWM